MSAAEHPTPPLPLGEIAEALHDHADSVESELGMYDDFNRKAEAERFVEFHRAAATTLEGLEARERNLAELFAWLMGESGDFPTSEPGRRYGFRAELARRLESIGFDYARLRAVVGTGTEEEQSAAQEGIRG